jgi:hypothetical protein
MPIEDVNGTLQDLIDNGESGNTGLQKLVQQPYAVHPEQLCKSNIRPDKRAEK